MDRDTVTQVTSVQVGKGPARDSMLLGKYRVESTLGFGGMGLVIKAHNLALDERVAIKILREDVQLDEGRVDPTRAVDLMLQTCDAIAEAHALGIVHRDIKPTNLFLTRRRDGSDLLKVLDFGISKAQFGPDMSLTQTSSMLGTPAYMSPEQMRNARTVDPRSDIWSLGCVLYELVEGDLPFDAQSFAELCVMVSLEPHAAIEHAPQLASIIDRCLAKSNDDRFQNVGELAEALIPFASDPQRARREVTRIQRMLANAPEYRDATPLPGGRGSAPQIPRTPVAAAVIDTTVRDAHGGHGTWKLIVGLVLLFGIGIGAGLWVTHGEGDDTTPPIEPSTPAVAPVVPADAAEAIVVAPDAAVIEPAPAPVAAKPPVAKPKPPTAKPKPSVVKPKPPVAKPPTAKPCDPFANSHGC